MTSGRADPHGQRACLLLSPPRVFLPINDQQTVPLEGTKTCLQGSQHRNRDIGGVTFLKRACNDIALAGDTVLAFCDEPISLGLVCQHSAARYVT